MVRKILLAGGTGFIGSALAGRLSQLDFTPVILSRNAGNDKGAAATTPDGDGLVPENVFANVEAIVNLAGENIGQYWTRQIKEKILTSRITATNHIVRAMQRNAAHGLAYPKVLINASAVGYYGNRPRELLTEASENGGGYLARVCREWEQEALRALDLRVRVTILRFGIVLGRNGGALMRMAQPFRWKLGGVIGDGSQYISWVHIADVAHVIHTILERNDMQGVYNVTSPAPVSMAEFMRELGERLQSPSWTRLPGFAARILFGEMAEENLLASQQVLPRRLLDMGYEFLFPTLSEALADIY